MKHLAIVLMIGSTFPLPLYPFVLMANIMSLTSEPAEQTPAMLVSVAAYLFIALSTLYPLPYTYGMLNTVNRLKNEEPAGAAKWQLLPAAWLVVTVLAYGGLRLLG